MGLHEMPARKTMSVIRFNCAIVAVLRANFSAEPKLLQKNFSGRKATKFVEQIVEKDFFVE